MRFKRKNQPLTQKQTTMYYRNILEPYHGMNSRHRCPQCGQKTFARYISTETGEYLADHIGRCNREDKCGYHVAPKSFIEANENGHSILYKRNPVEAAKKASYIPVEMFKASLLEFGSNSFFKVLNGLYGEMDARAAFDLYNIGSSKRWAGAAVFWQIDNQSRIRTGKIMLYNPETGKRVKDDNGKSLIDWAHRFTGLTPFNLDQCFFGEHLLRGVNNDKPVAIVESEKTAVIANIHLPEFTWLACGAKTGLNDSKCAILKDKKVILYPDLGCYEDWAVKAKKYGFAISDSLEQHATDEQRAKGLDLADFLIKDFLDDDGKIDLNTHYLMYNKIANTWDKIEKAFIGNEPEKVATLTSRLRGFARKTLIEHLGLQYAPKAFNTVNQQLINKKC